MGVNLGGQYLVKICWIEALLNIMFVTCISCRYEYHWADGTNIKKPIKCSAPKYIDYLMTWVQDQLDDETLFPSKIGTFCVRFLYPVMAIFFFVGV